MKKLLSVILAALILTSAAALAEVDLSGMSYAELLALRNQVQQELITRPEWKEVTVPPGLWTVGEDIPAGSYTLTKALKRDSGNVCVWGKDKDDYKSDGGLLLNTTLGSNREMLGKVVLKDGNKLEIQCTVIMSPVKGLGF